MPHEKVYGQRLGDAFGLREAPALINRTLKKSTIAVTQLMNSQSHVMTDPLPVDDAYLIGFQAADCLDHEIWMDGKSVACEPFTAGVTTFYDLRRDPRAFMRNPSHCLMYYIPRSALDFIADEAGARRIEDLHHPPGIGAHDEVMRSLTTAIIPAFANPDQASRLFIEHITLAVSAHLAQTYGGMAVGRAASGGLAPWQERRAKEIIDANLCGEIPLSWLAQECGLSTGHFSRAFRRSTGVAPHRWLLQRRVEVARDMLRTSGLPLCDVALACGFADQSHFTRVFRDHTGTSPGSWRRHAGASES